MCWVQKGNNKTVKEYKISGQQRGLYSYKLPYSCTELQFYACFIIVQGEKRCWWYRFKVCNPSDLFWEIPRKIKCIRKGRTRCSSIYPLGMVHRAQHAVLVL